jgi:ElaB/YqjD/DUF883 family membrane-anchored ribosome-binding protein
MDTTDIFEQNKKQLVDKANEFSDNAQSYLDQAMPYIDKITKYARANPLEAMAVTGFAAFVLGTLFSARRG